VLAGVATDVAVESTARGACDLGYRTVVVSDACTADSDQAHASALDLLQKWFAETPTADGGTSTKPHPRGIPERKYVRRTKQLPT
jgi:nicotinamidase-related amidase